jgi:hypothetical protein
MSYLPYLDHIDPGQGGGAMVIPTYNWYQIPVKPEVFPCSECTNVYKSYDEWFDHRFHAHPIIRPVLVLGTHELQTPRFVIMKPLSSNEIHVLNALSCLVDGKNIQVLDLPNFLASKTNGFCKIQLFGKSSNVKSVYEISVEISQEFDLRSVETDFAQLSAIGVIDIQTINSFIRSAKKAKTARKYIDGLANYLFGLIGKDQRGQTGLNQEQALARFNEAHEALSFIERPLARVLCAVIEFQLNTFSNRSGLGTVPRLEHAMQWFDSCRRGDFLFLTKQQIIDDKAVAKVPLDFATSEILSWIGNSIDELSANIKHIEKRIKQADWLPTDRVKGCVLLAAYFKLSGKEDLAKSIARDFRHDSIFGEMAESLIVA